jgi:hypothetical protein
MLNIIMSTTVVLHFHLALQFLVRIARFVFCTEWFVFVQTMDISKMSPGDCSFTAPFKLVANRDDFIHALVAYFDVSFTKCHKLMGFSTG